MIENGAHFALPQVIRDEDAPWFELHVLSFTNFEPYYNFSNNK